MSKEINCPACDAEHTVTNLEFEERTVECDFEVCASCGSTFAVMWDDPNIHTATLKWGA